MLFNRIFKIGPRIRNRVAEWKAVKGSKKPPIRKGITSKRRQEEIIISLTSFEPRLPHIARTLNTLLRQSVKPNRIIVWLSCDLSSVPDEVIVYTKRGVEFRHVPLDLKGHKKYFYAMQEFPNSLIITVDDDIIYSCDLIASLLKTHKKYPKAIVGRRVHLISMDHGKPAAYEHWQYEIQTLKRPSYMLFCTGSGGVLYPPGSLNESVLNSNAIQTLCLCGDDIWLKYMSLLNGTKTVWAENHCLPLIQAPNSQAVSLSTENVIGKRNDLYVNNMEIAFHNGVAAATLGAFYQSKP